MGHFKPAKPSETDADRLRALACAARAWGSVTLFADRRLVTRWLTAREAARRRGATLGELESDAKRPS